MSWFGTGYWLLKGERRVGCGDLIGFGVEPVDVPTVELFAEQGGRKLPASADRSLGQVEQGTDLGKGQTGINMKLDNDEDLGVDLGDLIERLIEVEGEVGSGLVAEAEHLIEFAGEVGGAEGFATVALGSKFMTKMVDDDVSNGEGGGGKKMPIVGERAGIAAGKL